eukprot:CAMPEP_0174752382 /NCGR_PEP_ID=MMETSP1094-20130205/101907_1 /TAXON_ID=156173 /ORGANISM="Chrysochromulina brevifilum, Strain UTEX LB 985" /LENGTH=283 /DNA_ID=CAMNT_0015958021 /DNA_START=41 /DNA_END=888 /DNA_ORIENTATION=-
MVGGMELWRGVWALPTQVLLFPVALATRGAVADGLFTYVFALYMVLDFFLAGQIEFIYYVHHGVCILGHAIVVLTLPAEAFDTYFAGVVMLEFGSGVMNVWALNSARWATVLYAVGMTASNVAAGYYTWQWSQLPIAMAPKVLCMAIAASLIMLRQQACHENLRIGAPRHFLRWVRDRWSRLYLTPKYLAATFITFVLPLVFFEFVSKDIGLFLLGTFGFLSCFGRSVGRQSKKKWSAAATLWPAKLPNSLHLQRGYLINRHRLKLRRFTVEAERPKAACILV